MVLLLLVGTTIGLYFFNDNTKDIIDSFIGETSDSISYSEFGEKIGYKSENKKKEEAEAEAFA